MNAPPHKSPAPRDPTPARTDGRTSRSGPTVTQAITATLARLSEPTPPAAEEVVSLVAALHHAALGSTDGHGDRRRDDRGRRNGNGSERGGLIAPNAEAAAAIRTAGAHLRAGALEDAYLALCTAADRIHDPD